MKELNELELREVEGGMPLALFFKLGPITWLTLETAEFIAGFEDGYDAKRRE